MHVTGEHMPTVVLSIYVPVLRRTASSCEAQSALLMMQSPYSAGPIPSGQS